MDFLDRNQHLKEKNIVRDGLDLKNAVARWKVFKSDPKNVFKINEIS